MIEKNSVVIYKNQAAVVCGTEGDKILIRYCSTPATSTGKKAVYSEQKVREKDVVFLSKKPCSSLEKLLDFKDEDLINRSFAIDPLFTISLSPYGTGNYTIVLITDTGECYEGSFVL